MIIGRVQQIWRHPVKSMAGEKKATRFVPPSAETGLPNGSSVTASGVNEPSEAFAEGLAIQADAYANSSIDGEELTACAIR